MPKVKLVGEGRTAEVFAWNDGHVLKLYRAGLPSTWCAAEAERARVVSAAGVPAPRLIEVVTVAGRPGIVYEQVAGPVLLPTLWKQP